MLTSFQIFFQFKILLDCGKQFYSEGLEFRKIFIINKLLKFQKHFSPNSLDNPKFNPHRQTPETISKNGR